MATTAAPGNQRSTQLFQIARESTGVAKPPPTMFPADAVWMMSSLTCIAEMVLWYTT